MQCYQIHSLILSSFAQCKVVSAFVDPTLRISTFKARKLDLGIELPIAPYQLPLTTITPPALLGFPS